jgi:type I site-specific restriction endonuclease
MSNINYPELSNDHDESIHIQPYADMIDRLTYVQKADFAKHALDLERDLATYKAMLKEVTLDRDLWIAECKLLRADNNSLCKERKTIIETNASQALKLSKFENQWHPSKQEQIDELAEQLNQQEGRANALEEWLTEYRDQLKKENAFHKNTGIINAINELLNES